MTEATYKFFVTSVIKKNQLKTTQMAKNFGSIKNSVLYKSVNPKKHILRVANAYGIDANLYSKLPDDGEIVLKEPTRKLWASRELFERHAFTRDFGAGVQKFLPLEKWLIIR